MVSTLACQARGRGFKSRRPRQLSPGVAPHHFRDAAPALAQTWAPARRGKKLASRFSERMGFVQPRTVIQMDDMDAPLRNSIWNLFVLAFENPRGSQVWVDVAKRVAIHVLKQQVEVVSETPWQAKRWLKEEFNQVEWYTVYDLLEFVAEEIDSITLRTSTPLSSWPLPTKSWRRNGPGFASRAASLREFPVRRRSRPSRMRPRWRPQADSGPFKPTCSVRSPAWPPP